MSGRFDMVVIGGGPGGYVAALRARQLGLSVALAEADRVGGVCLNRGCIPTKALLSDAEGLQWAKRAVKDGLIESVPRVDFTKLMARKSAVVERLVSGLSKHLSAAGITMVSARARIEEPGRVVTDSGETLEARHIVVATGSRSWTPPIPGADLPGVLTTRQILELEKLPENLVIIGAGVIGQEFAAVFASLGSKVTILEVLDRILPPVDSELARKYASMLSPRGIRVHTSVRIDRIEPEGDGLRVVYEKKSQEKTAEADLVLVAAGRRPFLVDLGLEALGLDLSAGKLQVDGHLRTPVDGVWAIGDVIGGKMLAHEASFHGETVAENIAGEEKSIEDEPIPCAVFTMPNIAWVGLTEEEAAGAGISCRVSTVSLASSGKALAMGEPRGWFKLLEDTGTGRLVGAHLMGPHAAELIGEMTLALKQGMSASDLAAAVHPHPTVSESLREAALGLTTGAIHTSARVKSIGGKSSNTQ